MLRSSIGILLSAALLAAPAAADDGLRIGGTGMALGVMARAAGQLSRAAPDFSARILPSFGTSGGVKALLAGSIDIALAARGANESETARGVSDALCLKTAFIFATPHHAAFDLRLSQLPGLYAAASPRWPDGSPVRIILRPRSGSEVPYLIARIPAMAAAFDAAFARTERPVALTDQENAALAAQMPGAFAMMTLVQLRAENLPLAALPLDGVEASVASLADGSYPLPLRFCLLTAGPARPVAARFLAHLRTPQAAALLRELGALLE
jgi:phosphate transport system substrate-binding protein